ncbi:MAG: hypothetical protein FJ033_09970 [Chloroflexi bacterium]|nr:hypothetical protein [Chloroflexota bacterium]
MSPTDDLNRAEINMICSSRGRDPASVRVMVEARDQAVGSRYRTGRYRKYEPIPYDVLHVPQ